MMEILKIEELSEKAFSEFGTYLNPKSCGDALGGNGAINFYPDRMLTLFEHSNMASLSPLRVKPRKFEVSVTEVHLHTEEVIGGFQKDVIFHVALGNSEKPDLNTFRIFRLPAGWWVRVKRGIWHQAPFTLENEEVVGIVILPPATYANDAVVVELEEKLEINARIFNEI